MTPKRLKIKNQNKSKTEKLKKTIIMSVTIEIMTTIQK